MEYVIRFKDKQEIITLKMSNWGGVQYLIENLKKEKVPFMLLMHDIKEEQHRTAKTLLDYNIEE